MKKVLRFCAILFGAIALITGAGSCKKQECCEWNDGVITYKYCEDDNLQGYTWSYFKYLAESYGGECKKEKV